VSVLVTGGAGYIGAVTASRLVASGREVVVLDDLSTGHRDNARFGAFVEGDIADAGLVRSTLETHGVSAVLHFAAKALVGESVAHPALYDTWNRGKTTALVEVCAAAGVQAFVFSSTCAVYGAPETIPINESTPLAPINPYGESKVACETALFESGLPAIALRYFNAAGAAPDVGLWERHDPETHLIPLCFDAVLGGRPLTVLGTGHPTPDGTCVRDYVHVLDLADAHIAALDALESGAPGGAFNLGTGDGASVRQVIDAVAAVAERPVPHTEGAARAGDPPTLVADPSLMADTLGFRTQHDLIAIVRDAWTARRLASSPE